MALKKKKMSKSEREQLYMLEILIDCLNLYPEKIINNEERDLMIRVSFIDLTSVDIVAEELTELKGSKNKEKRFSDEYINYEGKTCLFVRTPSNLIRSIKSTPLSVEVYRILREEHRNSRDDAGQVLVCAAMAFLPRYFCDRIVAAKNEIDGPSKPYTLMQVYTLTDEQGQPCGSVSMYLRLSCFGSSIINHLTLHEKSFVFRGFPLGSKFHCENFEFSDENINEKKNGQRDDDAFLLLSKILDSAYSKLHDEKDIDARFALTRPESPPRVSMNQPGFEKLTSAEKLNDRKYRGLIYEIYPDEPTCSCLPTNRSTHPMICRSGCVRSCCMALRNPDNLKNPSLATLTDCNDNLHMESGAEEDVNCPDNTRMRGGDDTDDNHLNSNALWNEEWYRHNNFKNRMKGGSDYGAASETTTSIIYKKSKKAGINSPYKSRPRPTDGAKPAAGCVCPGRDLSSWRTGTSKCTKKPCVGADCMIRAFKEAQEFVDSIGKVPGLVGLGLMDPSESPYFGRDVDKDYSVQKIPSERKRASPDPFATLPNLQCTAPCNTQIKPVISAQTIKSQTKSSISTLPIMTAVPGRPGVVREAIPSLPAATLDPITVKKKKDKKEDKKEEKLEKQKEKEPDVATTAPLDVDVGPCGEPKCKSRRKKPRDDRPTPHEIVEETQKSLIPPSTVKDVSKFIKRRPYPRGKALPGPDGDRDVARGPIKVSKRVMRHIYSIGDVYPGTNYGHKNCIDPRMRIPANMGWLWNTSMMVGQLKYPRIGWKPGAIGRYLNELLKAAKGASLPEDSRSRSIPSRTGLRRNKLYKSLSHISSKKEEAEEEVEPPPTLHIHRKDGTYYVTMYPIRQETGDVPQLEEPMKPLQFKIVRNKDDVSVASSSTASDMEIEFSPPAAVNRYRKKPDVIHVDTQVRQQEILDAFKSPVDAPKKKEKKGRKGKK
ncbi:hypothetical protein EAG_16263 [Camponotus floridanus]|uniref:DUF4776 domain-containing protein n=1 Tax=Camponotus floridanus TaxID=104421 RepID=E2AG90_CAMFO|nr:hypothetical protein EAG_16263 [Camponotus floridanus]